ncbi:MAG: Wzz/FepE/Etk N-terminal domain-containing protein [Candidatus Neomarinimicrobiota bacterium]|jgi:capsular polysaccharide biosynthesis protein|nr:Wzz/FepE/Etk N-terminal domain-containing protein [Candidatus Neomarinimicrobiota bacterium]MDD3966589.1 Wzz/FepE/Etk N-terminal domain-containing protein [Candidatus Neomarinimicrobiota bacterium]
MAEDLSLRDYYRIFKKNKWFIGIFTFTVSVLAIVISLLLPKWYAGTAVILRPQSQVLDMSSFQMKTMGLLGSTDGVTNRYLSILNSYGVKEYICKKYELMDSYKMKYMSKTIEHFEDNYKVEIGDEAQILITVYDRDQERVADMTNDVVTLLDSINISLAAQYGREERTFIEAQLMAILDSLNILENELLGFMENYNVLSVEDQVRTQVQYAADLKYQIMIKEMELKIMKQTRQNELLIDSQEIMIREMKAQYDKLFLPDKELFINLKQAPDITIFMKKIERKLNYFNEVLMFVGPLYEQAKITEAKEVPTFEVLDYAHRPDRKAKPKRAIIVIAAFMFALLSSGVYVLLKETQE